MIHRIGVICQDRNSFGFLLGLRRRLGCQAELIEPETIALGKSKTMTRTQAKIAARDFSKKGVDLIIRFTDADQARWQDVRRHEESVFPDDVRSIVVCGVAVDNVEQWLALDRSYVGEALAIPDVMSIRSDALTGAIKNAIVRNRQADEPVTDVAARIVMDAPASVFRAWLRSNDSLRHFYQDCRQAARQAECNVPNELDDAA